MLQEKGSVEADHIFVSGDCGCRVDEGQLLLVADESVRQFDSP